MYWLLRDFKKLSVLNMSWPWWSHPHVSVCDICFPYQIKICWHEQSIFLRSIIYKDKGIEGCQYVWICQIIHFFLQCFVISLKILEEVETLYGNYRSNLYFHFPYSFTQCTIILYSFLPSLEISTAWLGTGERLLNKLLKVYIIKRILSAKERTVPLPHPFLMQFSLN